MNEFPMREIDYKALRLLMERSVGGSDVQKARHIRKFDLAWRKGALRYHPEEDEKQKWFRCEARFCLGDYSDWSGWQYRDNWAKKVWFKNPFPIPVWDTTRVKRLYVIGEQGLGDEVLFSQTILNAKEFCEEVTFECQDRMVSLFERSLGIKCKGAVVNADGFRLYRPFEADAWVTLGELPRVFRKKWTDFPRVPYIRPDESRLEEMEQYRGRVGVSWRGAQGTTDWRELKKLYPNAISLQYDHDEEEFERPHIDLRNDVEGIFALVSVLSKVVSVSTTVAHFAASSGVPIDIVIADKGTGIRNHILPWRWLDVSQKTPKKSWWYGDNVKVYQSLKEYRAYQ